MVNDYMAIEVLDWESDLVHRMRDISDVLRKTHPDKVVEFTSRPLDDGKWELQYTISETAQLLNE
tara:strand:+ start:1240 stop:1434 length:195 start_codon:yes stop_codon:yes gene_type:complete